ncbi:MAG: LysR family transcriptional activator of nhaA [Myxococcota bacterium]|jgi:LysR family transcriptional activator of nhaA
MDHLNFQHLRYFWMTAREGHLTRASALLRLSPSTVSAQIKTLEESLGYPLFERRGRGLVLTERGELVKAYADDIFALGQEMVDSVRRATGTRYAYRFRVGVGNDLPKLIAWELLSPALRMDDFPVHLVVHEDRPDRLVADLAVHHLDMVIVDSPVGLSSDVRANSVLLGESTVSLMAAPKVAAQVLRDFPRSLEGAPLLLPEVGSAMRTLLEQWFDRVSIRPHVVAEFGDSALLKAFGQEGAGVFAVPTAIRGAVEAQYNVLTVGELEDAWERVYAVVMPSRMENKAVQAVLAAADKNVRLNRTESGG